VGQRGGAHRRRADHRRHQRGPARGASRTAGSARTCSRLNVVRLLHAPAARAQGDILHLATSSSSSSPPCTAGRRITSRPGGEGGSRSTPGRARAGAAEPHHDVRPSSAMRRRWTWRISTGSRPPRGRPGSPAARPCRRILRPFPPPPPPTGAGPGGPDGESIRREAARRAVAGDRGGGRQRPGSLVPLGKWLAEASCSPLIGLAAGVSRRGAEMLGVPTALPAVSSKAPPPGAPRARRSARRRGDRGRRPGGLHPGATRRDPMSASGRKRVPRGKFKLAVSGRATHRRPPASASPSRRYTPESRTLAPFLGNRCAQYWRKPSEAPKPRPFPHALSRLNTFACS